MIDIHSHILSGIDDGSKSLSMSLQMARLAVDDGVHTMVASPHFMPGIYDTTIEKLTDSIQNLQTALEENGIPLKLLSGGDVHAAPDLVKKLNSKLVPTIAKTRYFLFEPPHTILPPKLPELAESLLRAGYVPVLTHPERLSWIEQHYDVICQLAESGLPIQLTAKSVTGGFGKRAKYWSDRLLEEGRVDFVASDAHNVTSRPPGLSRAYQVIESRLGTENTNEIFTKNPALLLQNKPLVSKLPKKSGSSENKRRGLFSSLIAKLRLN